MNIPGCSSNFAPEKMEAKLSSCPDSGFPFKGADSLAVCCAEGCHAGLPPGFDMFIWKLIRKKQ